MKSFVDWVDEGNFWIRGSYDPIQDIAAPRGPLQLFDHQREILGHCLTPNAEGRLPYTTVIYSCPKKSGKTTIGAAVGAWFQEEAVDNTSVFCLAGDYEHAMGRMFDDLLFDAQHPRPLSLNGKLSKSPRKDLLTYQDGKTIQALAQEYKSASGSRHALTLWDELWTYISETSRRMWIEMTPIQIPGVPVSLRFVSTYAGFEGESDLLWSLYDKLERCIKFSLVGMVGFAIHFGLLYLLTDKVGLWYLWSAVIAITTANLNNYILNHLWTFKSKRQYNTNLFRGWLKYMLAVGVTEGMYLGLIFWFTSILGLYYLLSAFFALALTTGIRYWTAEKWVWRKPKMSKVA